MKKLILFLILLTSALPAFGDGMSETLKNDGVFRFSDGSSIYSFHEDGSFDLQPCGMSGRTIKGNWKEIDGFLVVEGEWSWLNGLSSPGDTRIMRLHVNASPTGEKETAGMNQISVDKVYFTIESIRKVEPNQSEVSIQLRAPRSTS